MAASYCLNRACRHRTIISADEYPDDIEVPLFALRLTCSKCGCGGRMADNYAASTLTTGSVAVGGSMPGSIETTGDADRFALTLTAGVTYRFDLLGSATGQGTLSYPELRLLDGAGQERLMPRGTLVPATN